MPPHPLREMIVTEFEKKNWNNFHESPWPKRVYKQTYNMSNLSGRKVTLTDYPTPNKHPTHVPLLSLTHIMKYSNNYQE